MLHESMWSGGEVRFSLLMGRRWMLILNTLKLSAGRWVVAGGEGSEWIIGSCHIMTFSSVVESLFQ